jgi:AcrR family transcriptional regulator
MTRDEKALDIYRTALSIFAEYGFKKTTIEDIANARAWPRAHCTFMLTTSATCTAAQSSVAFGEWQARVREAVIRCEDPLSKLHVLTHKAYLYLADDTALRRILARDPDLFPLFPSKDTFTDINERSVSMLREVLEEGRAAGVFEMDDVDATARSFFSIYIMFIQKPMSVKKETPCSRCLRR